MSSSSDPQRYDARRVAARAQREATARRLLASADELFRANGYAATSVVAIARGAGVSLQTLYLAWGSKRALLRAATDSAASESSPPTEPDAWRASLHQRILGLAKGSPRASDYLHAFAAVFTEIATLAGDYWRINRDAAAVDLEVAADWAKLLSDRRATVAQLAGAMPKDGLRAEVDVQRITDTLWMLAGPNLYELAATQPGHEPAQYQKWLGTTLVAALTTD